MIDSARLEDPPLHPNASLRGKTTSAARLSAVNGGWNQESGRHHRWHDLGAWRLHTTGIWGGIAGYDHAAFLNAFTAEGLLSGDHRLEVWGRLEVLQRTSAELEVATNSGPNVGLWVGALTLGARVRIVSLLSLDVSAWASGTLTAVPDVYAAYGGNVVPGGKVFLELRGMQGFTFELRRPALM